MTRDVYLVDGARTPFLKARQGPGPFTPVDLAVQCGRPLLMRQPFGLYAVDLLILGCVNVVPEEMNPARVAALRLGLPSSAAPEEPRRRTLGHQSCACRWRRCDGWEHRGMVCYQRLECHTV